MCSEGATGAAQHATDKSLVSHHQFAYPAETEFIWGLLFTGQEPPFVSIDCCMHECRRKHKGVILFSMMPPMTPYIVHRSFIEKLFFLLCKEGKPRYLVCDKYPIFVFHAKLIFGLSLLRLVKFSGLANASHF